MVAFGTATLVSTVLINKFVLIAAVGLLIYFTGGFDIITENPILVVFAGLLLLVTMSEGGKKK